MTTVHAVEALDLDAAADADLLAFHDVSRAVERAAGVPGVLMEPPAHGLLQLRHIPVYSHRRAFVVRDGGRIVGTALAEWDDVPSNRDHVQVTVEVVPPHRRRGLGGALLAAAVDAACHEFDARILDVEARRDDDAAAGFLGRFGFDARLTSPRNVVWARDLDRRLLEGWVARAAERASGYELVQWKGAVPEEHLDDFVDLWHVMNTAPLEDLDWDDEVMTPERSREWDAHLAARGITQWTVMARHVPSGEAVGFTVVTVHEHWPAVAEQEDTGVRPEHRGRGIGRWVKAVNALRLLDEAPAVEALTTWNAGSNEPMLAINHAMGFRPLEWWAEWQADAHAVLGLLTRV